MIQVRDSARRVIDLQLNGAEDAEIKQEQARLNGLYDRYTAKYGLLSSSANKGAFEQDSAYPLLCSLEIVNENGKLERKADIFTKRTIQHHTPVTSVDTSAEALAVSIGEKACVDLGYMASLMGGSEQIPRIVKELQGIIFKDPSSGPFDLEEGGEHWYKGWQTAGDYCGKRPVLCGQRGETERGSAAGFIRVGNQRPHGRIVGGCAVLPAVHVRIVPYALAVAG